MLTYETIDVDTLPVIDPHGRTDHLIYELLGKAGFLHGFIDGLVKHLGEVVPSKGVEEALVSAEGVVVCLVAIDPLTRDKEMHLTAAPRVGYPRHLILERERKRSVAADYLCGPWKLRRTSCAFWRRTPKSLTVFGWSSSAPPSSLNSKGLK